MITGTLESKNQIIHNKNLRVVHMANEFPPNIFGGLGTAVGGLAVALARAGISIAVLLIRDYYSISYQQSSFFKFSNTLNDEITSYLTAPLIYQVTLQDGLEKCLKFIHAWKPDIIHLHSFWLFPLAIAIKRHVNIPFVYTVHSLDRAEYEIGAAPQWVFTQSSTQLDTMNMSDRIIALSRSERDLIIKYYPHLADVIRIVGNGINKYYSVQPFKKNKNPKDACIVLYTGRFVDRKGIRDLLRAIPLVIRKVPQVQFVFVGGHPGGTPSDMEKWWLSADLIPYRHQIRFTGWVSTPELLDWYRNSDILVVPSWYEPFGMVILEGMSHGLAIVASDVGGPAEILEHGITGLLFPPRNVEILSEMIISLLENPELRSTISNNAFEQVRSKWLWSNKVKDMCGIYHEIVTTKGSLGILDASQSNGSTGSLMD